VEQQLGCYPAEVEAQWPVAESGGSSPAAEPGKYWGNARRHLMSFEGRHLAPDLSRNVSMTWQQSTCSASLHFSSDAFSTRCTWRKSISR
jgi:hypothetical protein